MTPKFKACIVVLVFSVSGLAAVDASTPGADSQVPTGVAAVPEALALVNDEAILVNDVERRLMLMHQSASDASRVGFDLDRLMFRMVNDVLIGQEARALGLAVTVEGIETETQDRFLQQAGCELGQGFGFARPQDARAIEHYLR